LRTPDPRWAAAVCALLFSVVACGAGALYRASVSYKRDRDCPSLELIAKDLRGTRLARVQALLGPPDYEPTPGQHYYSSTRSDCSLVLDYRRAGQLTDIVQHVELGAIGE
jgi:hypothetical protein